LAAVRDLALAAILVLPLCRRASPRQSNAGKALIHSVRGNAPGLRVIASAERGVGRKAKTSAVLQSWKCEYQVPRAVDAGPAESGSTRNWLRSARSATRQIADAGFHDETARAVFGRGNGLPAADYFQDYFFGRICL